MSDEPTFTRAAFLATVHDLRARFGTISFWENPEAERIALKGLFYVANRTQPWTATDFLILESTVWELGRRGQLVRLRPS